MRQIGFTGTREGMTEAQKDTFVKLLQPFADIDGFHFHHGDCVGADSDAHDIVLRWSKATIYIHPPEKTTLQANKRGGVVFAPKPYMQRNKDIVDISDLLVATPSGYFEQRAYSGTWATIRMARKKGIEVVIIFPNGGYEYETATGKKQSYRRI